MVGACNPADAITYMNDWNITYRLVEEADDGQNSSPKTWTFEETIGDTVRKIKFTENSSVFALCTSADCTSHTPIQTSEDISNNYIQMGAKQIDESVTVAPLTVSAIVKLIANHIKYIQECREKGEKKGGEKTK